MIVLMTVLSLGRVLDAGFDQIFNLYSPVVYETGDILDTYIYRMAFTNSQFSISTAAGLFKSAIGCILIVASYRLAYVFSGYQVF
jgi:putative aldouronate transport system permease protein